MQMLGDGWVTAFVSIHLPTQSFPSSTSSPVSDEQRIAPPQPNSARRPGPRGAGEVGAPPIDPFFVTSSHSGKKSWLRPPGRARSSTLRIRGSVR
jgi:hypothetical protein